MKPIAKKIKIMMFGIILTVILTSLTLSYPEGTRVITINFDKTIITGRSNPETINYYCTGYTIGRKNKYFSLSSIDDRFRTAYFYDLSQIPAGSTIYSVIFVTSIYNCQSTSYNAKVVSLSNSYYNSGTCEDVYNAIGGSSSYASSISYSIGANHEIEADASAISDLQSVFDSEFKKFGIGFMSEDEGTDLSYANGYITLKIIYYPPTYQVTFKLSFGSGTLKIDGNTTNIPAEGLTLTMNRNSQHTLDPMNGQESDYYARLFEKWKKNNNENGDDNPKSITVTNDAAYEAVYLKACIITFQNSFVSAGNGGVIEVNSVQYNSPTSTFTVKEKDYISMSAVDQTINGIIFNFSQWSDGNTSRSRNYVAEMHKTFTANFIGIPTHVTITSYGGADYTPVQLNWDNHLNENVTQYQIWRGGKRNGIPVDTELIATLNRPTNTYTDYDYINNSQYGQDLLKYNVRAYYSLEGTYASPNWVTVWGDVAPKIAITKNDKNPLFESCESSQYSVRNYPNPCNPSTTFSIELPNSEFVQLKIFDQIGREITTLVNGLLLQGRHNIKFNGINLSSGIYMYKIIAGKFNKTGKFMLMK